MIFKIELDLELTVDEIKILRKYFDKEDTKLNPYFMGYFNKKFNTPESINNIREILSSLEKKEVLREDQIHNYELTIVGKFILSKINRENLINKLLED